MGQEPKIDGRLPRNESLHSKSTPNDCFKSLALCGASKSAISPRRKNPSAWETCTAIDSALFYEMCKVKNPIFRRALNIPRRTGLLITLACNDLVLGKCPRITWVVRSYKPIGKKWFS